MNSEYKYEKFSLIDLALDCCAYYYLLAFWLFIFLFPLLYFIIFLWEGFDFSLLFIIILFTFIIISIIPYYISKGIINRNKFIISFGIFLTAYKIYMNIRPYKDFTTIKLANNLWHLWVLPLDIIVIIIFFISLFSKRVHKNK